MRAEDDYDDDDNDEWGKKRGALEYLARDFSLSSSRRISRDNNISREEEKETGEGR